MKREASSAFRAAVLRRASVLRKDAQRTLDRQPVFVEHDPQHGRRPSELLARFRAESHVGEVGGIRWCVGDNSSFSVGQTAAVWAFCCLPWAHPRTASMARIAADR